MKHAFLIWGTFSEILSGLGTEFTNEIILELCALLGIDKMSFQRIRGTGVSL